jgi:hypothetical protein
MLRNQIQNKSSSSVKIFHLSVTSPFAALQIPGRIPLPSGFPRFCLGQEPYKRQENLSLRNPNCPKEFGESRQNGKDPTTSDAWHPNQSKYNTGSEHTTPQHLIKECQATSQIHETKAGTRYGLDPKTVRSVAKGTNSSYSFPQNETPEIEEVF